YREVLRLFSLEDLGDELRRQAPLVRRVWAVRKETASVRPRSRREDAGCTPREIEEERENAEIRSGRRKEAGHRRGGRRLYGGRRGAGRSDGPIEQLESECLRVRLCLLRGSDRGSGPLVVDGQDALKIRDQTLERGQPLRNQQGGGGRDA